MGKPVPVGSCVWIETDAPSIGLEADFQETELSLVIQIVTLDRATNGVCAPGESFVVNHCIRSSRD